MAHRNAGLTPAASGGRTAVPGLDIWHFSTPTLGQAEIHEAGFEVVTYAGAEGFTGGMRRVLQRLVEEHPQALEELIALAAETSELPQYRDATEHLHFVVQSQPL